MHDAAFAERWYAAWNARDLDRILALYASDVEFSSPYVAALGFSETGVIGGKSALRDYFERALDRSPELAFQPESLCVGALGHVLIYRNHRGERAAEHHELNALGLIARADATYEAGA